MARIGNHQQLKLQDGRNLGYAEYGAPEGVPVFYFHGFPGSRLDYLFFDAGEAAAGTNARIIAAERPGYDLSDFKRGRSILDWPDDVTELADALQIDRFAVLGISGGGPYAAPEPLPSHPWLGHSTAASPGPRVVASTLQGSRPARTAQGVSSNSLRLLIPCPISDPHSLSRLR